MLPLVLFAVKEAEKQTGLKRQEIEENCTLYDQSLLQEALLKTHVVNRQICYAGGSSCRESDAPPGKHP